MYIYMSSTCDMIILYTMSSTCDMIILYTMSSTCDMITLFTIYLWYDNFIYNVLVIWSCYIQCRVLVVLTFRFLSLQCLTNGVNSSLIFALRQLIMKSRDFLKLVPFSIIKRAFGVSSFIALQRSLYFCLRAASYEVKRFSEIGSFFNHKKSPRPSRRSWRLSTAMQTSPSCTGHMTATSVGW